MPEKRLRVLLIGFALAALALTARLVHLQVVHADHYRDRAEQAVVLAPEPLPFVRGSIRDRLGDVLVADRACWDLKVDYAAIAAEAASDPDSLAVMARRLRREPGFAGLPRSQARIERFRAEMRAMWGDLTWFAAVSGLDPLTDQRATAREIYERIQRVRRVVASRRGFDAPVAEERMAHALLSELTADQQIRAREMFARYPWIHIEPTSTREIRGRLVWSAPGAPDDLYASGVAGPADSTSVASMPPGEPFAHLLGRVARVTAEHVATDPERDNPFARYEPDDSVGISGVEWLAERALRGRRGRVTRDRDGDVVEYIEAVDGADVRLTVHGALQRRLYRLLAEAVGAHPHSSGGAIVALDVPTREILALVSYPSYDPAEFDRLYPDLRDDTDRLPLRFRAVATRYAPGSTVKPLTCIAALINNVITTETTEECTGYLFEQVRDAWRCWQVHGTDVRMAHGPVNVVEALTGSCNVFMYAVGERLGIDRLCSAFDMAGIGRPTGVGLREEDTGINPTPSWLMSALDRPVTPGLPRLYAIGQGEIAMTPLQVANLMATYASGRWRPVRLLADETETPVWRLPGTPAEWNAVRRGIFGVTNDPDGTAFKYAHFERDGYVLCGKTGTATAHPWPTAYLITYRDPRGDEQTTTVRAGARGPAIERFTRKHPGAEFDPASVRVARRWPDQPPTHGENHAHAWFGGYLQAVGADGAPDFSREPRVAFAVLVEFGGSGGRTSGPLARQVASELLDVLGPGLDPDRNEFPTSTSSTDRIGRAELHGVARR